MAAEAPIAEGGSIVFSSFRLDRRAGRLTSAGRSIPLRPKTWAVLLHLVERAGALVAKGELLDAVWGDVAVTPDTLTKSIGELRVALGDDMKAPRFIETVHRRGFRFIGKVSGESATEAASPAGTAGDGGKRLFVGRAAELRQLGELYAKASAGERQIVFVGGPAGVGKTTLIDAFLDSPAIAGSAASPWIGRGACVEQHSTREAYMPVLEALGRLARRPDAAGLADLLRRTAPTWLAQLPWLIGDDAERMRRTLQPFRPERMLREFAALIEALTSELTLVLVLEDLHWSDPSTVDLLALLGQRLAPARLLVIGTYRPSDLVVQEHVLSPAIRTLRLRRQCVDLSLQNLSEEDVRHYLEARFPGAEIPANLARVIHQHTDGNPLFVAAIVDHMLSRGWILETAPGWSFVIPSKQIDLGVPDDVRQMIESELESLSPADREVLAAASVAGHSFAAAAIAGPLRRAIDDVESRCETFARSRRFLHVNGSTEWPDGQVARCYAFAHELYRQTAYEALPQRQRQRLHRNIGEVLEAAYGERAAEISTELATHAERGCDYERSLRYLTVAALRARQRFAGRDAINYLESALTLVPRLSDERARQRHELELRVGLAPLLNDHFGFASEELRQNCERAHQLCLQIGSPEQRFQILYALCHVYAVSGDKVRLEAATAPMDDLAQDGGCAEHRLLLDTVLARNAAHEGRFADVRRLAEGPLAAHLRHESSEQTAAYGADPVIATNCHYAYALWFLGDVERARATMRTSLAAAVRSDALPFTRAEALGFAAVLEMLFRNPAEVRLLAQQLLELTADYVFPVWSALAAALIGWVRIQEGEPQRAIEDIERARAAHAATGARVLSTHILALLAEARLRSGGFALGVAAADEGLRIAETTTDRSFAAELWRLKGELLLASEQQSQHDRTAAGGKTTPSHADEAERCLLQALETARGMEARSLELRAATSLARAWQAERPGDARTVLDGICRWFEADAQSLDLAEARAVLQQVSTVTRWRRERQPAHAGGRSGHRASAQRRRAPRR